MLFGPPPETAHSHIIKEWAVIEKWSVGFTWGWGAGRAFIVLLVFGLSDKQNEQKITSVLSRGVP